MSSDSILFETRTLIYVYIEISYFVEYIYIVIRTHTYIRTQTHYMLSRWVYSIYIEREREYACVC